VAAEAVLFGDGETLEFRRVWGDVAARSDRAKGLGLGGEVEAEKVVGKLRLVLMGEDLEGGDEVRIHHEVGAGIALVGGFGPCCERLLVDG